MVSSIGGNNTLQTFSALNAFRSVNRGSYDSFAKPSIDIDTPNGINLNDNNSLLDNVDVADIKNYAFKMGENNLTDEDIKYGITYGRSVIADYIA